MAIQKENILTTIIYMGGINTNAALKWAKYQRILPNKWSKAKPHTIISRRKLVKQRYYIFRTE